MIEHVYTQATKAIQNVFVATDDYRIIEAVEKFGGKAILTSTSHQSGTDRIAEAATSLRQLGYLFEVIINVQGDEPFIHPRQIEKLMSCFDDSSTQIATLIEKITSHETLFNPNSPKVIIDHTFRTIYFSRHPIPFIRGVEPANWINHHTFYKHIGIYAYRTELLPELAQLKPSKLEIAESLEQLRWLENGYIIKCTTTKSEGIAVDTPDDLEKANIWLRDNPSWP